jgi:nitrate reductase assembly molybdenum cofactor insertion protein NarJ
MHIWDVYFAVAAVLIVDLTPIGCGTVELLSMNDENRRELRGGHAAGLLTVPNRLFEASSKYAYLAHAQNQLPDLPQSAGTR